MVNVMRIISIKRLGLSAILGFLLPLSYAFMLSEFSDYTGKAVPEFMVMAFGWPRPIWIFLMGRQPAESDVIPGLLFLTLCNILLYGTLIYVLLSIFGLLKRKPVDYEPPPPPEQSHS
jgi:hypothetical protein